MGMNVLKIGSSVDLYGRRNTFQTGCPPNLEPSHDIHFITAWETTAMDSETLEEYEQEVFNKFYKYRMVRHKLGDTEWFQFPDGMLFENIKELIHSYIIIQPWFNEVVDIESIRPVYHPRVLKYHYAPNTCHIRSITEHDKKKSAIQLPMETDITNFLQHPVKQAAHVIVPCGGGKTRMSVRSFHTANIRRIVMCCPTNTILKQWRKEILTRSGFQESDILEISMDGETDKDNIVDFIQKPVFCILSTNASSHLLVDAITTHPPDLMIFDEAHRMAGVIPKTDSGEGKTRLLMVRSCELSIKRLFLTYTPRFFTTNEEAEQKTLMSMDDDDIFGECVAQLSLRRMITDGILPDYRVWRLYDEHLSGTGIIAKAESIITAWKSTEIYRRKERHIINHMIVFARTNKEAKNLFKHLSVKLGDTLVLRAKSGSNMDMLKEQFDSAERSIIVNCKVLGEGVDIPIADSVVITYPKESRCEITQMLLRAGRWHPDKPLFHILIPVIGEEDVSGLEDILLSLASFDDQIHDEIVHRSIEHNVGRKKKNVLTLQHLDDEPGNIIIDSYGSSEDDIRKCFENVRKNIMHSKNSRQIRALCIKSNIDTHNDYCEFKKLYPELPDDPRPKGVSWYDFLHPHIKNKMSIQCFRSYARQYKLNHSESYNNHLSLFKNQSRSLPSLEHIVDGYFGCDKNSFHSIIGEDVSDRSFR